MTRFVYCITEGVIDVTLITRVLGTYFDMKQIRMHSNLPEFARSWLDNFKWPIGDDIARLAVPAPVFMIRNDLLIALRNAQGLTRMKSTLDADSEVFLRNNIKLNALGVFVDADNNLPSEQFENICEKLDPPDIFPQIADLSSVDEVIAANDGRRIGIFVFPNSKTKGTLENLILDLGDAAFPDLHRAGHEFVNSWRQDHQADLLYKELNKPAGENKARLSTMAALLKPGKSLNASLQDQPWLPEDTPPAILQPLMGFLEKLVGGMV